MSEKIRIRWLTNASFEIQGCGQVILTDPCLKQTTFKGFDADSFDKLNEALELAGLFPEREILYTYDEYCEHMRLLEEFAQEHESLTLVKDAHSPFCNISIAVHRGCNVLVSKNTAPAIHFVVEEPDMVAAFEQFAPLGIKDYQ